MALGCLRSRIIRIIRIICNIGWIFRTIEFGYITFHHGALVSLSVSAFRPYSLFLHTSENSFVVAIHIYVRRSHYTVRLHSV